MTTNLVDQGNCHVSMNSFLFAWSYNLIFLIGILEIAAKSVRALRFKNWMRFLRVDLEPLIQLLQREVLRQHLLPLFSKHYLNTTFIINCTEIEMERLSSLDNQSAWYSQHKLRTMKVLIGITPSGATAFVSELSHLPLCTPIHCWNKTLQGCYDYIFSVS